MRSGSRNVQGQTLIILLIILTGALMGCGSGSGSAPAAAGTPGDQTPTGPAVIGTVIPTAPAELPELAPNAGADNRTINTINPGPNGLFDLVTGPGATFTPFTFDPAGFDDVVGSGGVISMAFTAISTDPNDPVDVCLPAVHPDPAQQAIADAGERLVTGRNTPT